MSAAGERREDDRDEHDGRDGGDHKRGHPPQPHDLGRPATPGNHFVTVAAGVAAGTNVSARLGHARTAAAARRRCAADVIGAESTQA